MVVVDEVIRPQAGEYLFRNECRTFPLIFGRYWVSRPSAAVGGRGGRDIFGDGGVRSFIRGSLWVIMLRFFYVHASIGMFGVSPRAAGPLRVARVVLVIRS